MKEIVQLTFLGTKQHRDTHQTCLKTMHDSIQRHSQTNAGSHIATRLFDGVGCHGTNEHPTPGTYYCKFDTHNLDGTKKKDSNPEETALEKQLYLFNNKFYLRETRSKITGAGFDSLLLEAKAYIKHITMLNQGIKPKTVNLQGFSRGADLCVRMANILFAYDPSIQVNLCLLDPVPGPGLNKDWDSYTIPPNVKSCEIIYLLNEHFYFFEPQDPKKYIFQNTQTHRRIHFLAGVHGTVNALCDKNPKHVASSYYLSRDTLLQFAIDHHSLPAEAKLEYDNIRQIKGVPVIAKPLVPPLPVLSNKDRFKHYCHNFKTFKSLEARLSAKYLFPHRRIMTNRDMFVRTPALFLDEEHRYLFKQLYPLVFHWFFEKNINQSDPNDVLKQLKEIQSTDFAKPFQQYFGLSDLKSLSKLPNPAGFPYKEQERFNQPLATDELTYYRNALTKIIECHKRFASKIEKKPENTKYINMINKVLGEVENMEANEALQALTKIIKKIQTSSDSGYVKQKIANLANMRTTYKDKVGLIISQALSNTALEDSQKKIIAHKKDEIDLILSRKDDDWEKENKIQSILILMHAELKLDKIKLAEKSSPPSSAKPHISFLQTVSAVKQAPKQGFESLSQELLEITRTSYTETNLVDKIIYRLRVYQYQQLFFSYFFFVFGYYNATTVQIAESLEKELRALKTEGLGHDLVAISRKMDVARNTIEQLSSDPGAIQPDLSFIKILGEHIRLKEADLVDKIIYDLNNYRARQIFFSYLFFAFGYHHSKEVAIAKKLVDRLEKLKYCSLDIDMIAISLSLEEAKEELALLTDNKPASQVAPALNKVLCRATQTIQAKISVLYDPPQSVIAA